MYLAHRWLDRNLTRLELVFALTLITIAIGVFLEKSAGLFEAAESSLVSATIANMETALKIHAVMLQVDGKAGELAAMGGMNPFDLMQAGPVEYRESSTQVLDPVLAQQSSISAPSNYAGEVDIDDSPEEPGKWYFNRNSRELVYVWRHRYLDLFGVEDAVRTRLKVEVVYDDADGDNVYNPGRDSFTGVRLVDLSEEI